MTTKKKLILKHFLHIYTDFYDNTVALHVANPLTLFSISFLSPK